MDCGIINVYKEAGMTSFAVVAAVRRLCGIKKVGHTGTLDPEAAGVLPICIGKATKVCALLSGKDKEYEAVLHLGIVTDTQDATGSVLRRADVAGIDEAMIRETAAAFTGRQMQTPPMYSAKKVGGKRLYEYARAGEEVKRKAVPVRIDALDILELRLPLVRMRVRCSKGTYIRTLCHDMGRSLGCGGVMDALVRTEAAGFRLADAHTLADLEALRDAGRLQEAVHSVEEVFCDMPGARVTAGLDRALQNGSKLQADAFADDAAAADLKRADGVRVYTSDGCFAGIYRYAPAERCFRAERIFLTAEKPGQEGRQTP